MSASTVSADQRVRERVAALADLRQQAGGDGGREPVDDALGGGQHERLELHPQRGAGLQDAAARPGEAGDAAADHLAHAGRRSRRSSPTASSRSSSSRKNGLPPVRSR